MTGSDHRFVHKDEENPSSTLADSPNTALKEVEGWLSAYSGFSVKIRPEEYRLITVQLQLGRVRDLRNPATKEALGPVANLITIQGHPDELKDLGRERQGEQVSKDLYGNQRKSPAGSAWLFFWKMCQRRT